MDETKKISIFDQNALNQQLSKLVPVGEDNAVIWDIDLKGTKFIAHVEKGEHWTIQGIYEHDWNGENALSGQVIYHWKN